MVSQNGVRNRYQRMVLQICGTEYAEDEMADLYQYLEAGIVNQGNTLRLKQCMARGAAGEKLVIGYLGGSITMGSVATVQEKCYAYLSYLWWKESFPQAQVEFVNAGIGATTSQFAVARVEEDLLAYKPDVVFIEFTVNDEATEHFMETYEGLLRKVYGHETKPAVITLQNAFYHDGVSAEAIHTPVAKHYDLPVFSFKKAVVERVRAGKIKEADITPDHLHPNDKGHALLAEAVRYYLDRVYAEWKNGVVEEKEAHVLPTALTKNRYETSMRLNNKNLIVNSAMNFVEDTSKQEHITQIFKNGWEFSEEGAYLEAELEATCLAIQYRRTMQHPAPSMRVLVDHNEVMILNGEFDETWGDLIALSTVFENDRKEKHQVRLELCNVHEDDKLPFYLVSFLVS